MIGVERGQDQALDGCEVWGVEDVVDEQPAGIPRTGVPGGFEALTGSGVEQFRVADEVVEGGSPWGEVEVADEEDATVGREVGSGFCGIGELSGAELEVVLSDGWHAVNGDQVYRAGWCADLS